MKERMTPVAHVMKGGVELSLYRSRIQTVEKIRDLPRMDIFDVYRAISGDARPLQALDPEKATSAVQAYAERAHFIRVQKLKPPPAIDRALGNFIEAAQHADARDMPTPQAGGRKKVIDIVEECLKAEMRTEEIIDAIYREHPDSKADRFTVANNRRTLRLAGKIPWFQAKGRRT